jgi:serine/threonine-protein kinase
VVDTNPTRSIAAGSGGPASFAALPEGTDVGGYRVVRLIGCGGCGAVYRATSPSGEGVVALKVLHDDVATDRDVVGRFVQEASILRRLRHPSIVDVREIGMTAGGRAFLVMELVDGESLATLLARVGSVAVAGAVELIAPVCAALDAAHAIGVVHRDVKPSNVLLRDDAADHRVVLADFGIAKLAGSALAYTRTGQLLGTPSSMAPEQILGAPITPVTDVYLLGVMTYRLLTGASPFPCDDAAKAIEAHVEAPRPRPSAIAAVCPAIDDVVMRAMAIQPTDRFTSAGAFAAAFELASR